MKIIENIFIDKAISYEKFLAINHNLVEQTKTSGDEQTAEQIKFTALNLQRLMRLNKTAIINEHLQRLIAELTEPITILVITESWCGDGAQQLPWFAKVAELSPLIALKILFRDEHPALISEFLTNGNKSIPVVLFLNKQQEVLIRLASRPKVLQQLFLEWSKEKITKEEKMLKVHSWYAKDKGAALQQELYNTLKEII
jgi:hypothetical protein